MSTRRISARKVYIAVVLTAISAYGLAQGQFDALVTQFHEHATGEGFSGEIRWTTLSSGMLVASLDKSVCQVDPRTGTIVSWRTLPTFPPKGAAPISEAAAFERSRSWCQRVSVELGPDHETALTSSFWTVRHKKRINGYETPLTVSVTMNNVTGEIAGFSRSREDVDVGPSTILVSPEEAIARLTKYYKGRTQRDLRSVEFTSTRYTFGGPSHVDGRDSRPLFQDRKLVLVHRLTYLDKARRTD